ncbi:hypothetical protein ACEPAF_9419 [Sanghuangporus sanghuang]
MVTEEKPRRFRRGKMYGIPVEWRLSKSTAIVMEVMPNAKDSPDSLKTSRAQRHEVLVALCSYHHHSRVAPVRNPSSSLVLSMPVVPAVYYVPNTHIISNTTNKLVRRDENDGGLKTSTKLGIAIGLICFFTILISFWFIWRLRRKPQVTTEDDIFAQETLTRWEENVLHGRRAPGSSGNALREQGRTRRASESTLATYTTYDTGDNIHLSKPEPAHITAHL